MRFNTLVTILFAFAILAFIQAKKSGMQSKKNQHKQLPKQFQQTSPINNEQNVNFPRFKSGEKQVIQTTTLPPPVQSIANCACAVGFSCPTCDGLDDLTSGCPCAPCPPCILAKTMKKMHDTASKEAKADSETQGQLADNASLMTKLFTLAQKYAIEAQEKETQAKEAAAEMQKFSSRAQISRNKMMKSERQAKELALKSIKTMTVHPPHSSTQTPDLSVHSTGIKHTTIVQNTPQYALNIAPSDASGFIDAEQQQIDAELADNDSAKEAIAQGRR